MPKVVPRAIAIVLFSLELESALPVLPGYTAVTLALPATPDPPDPGLPVCEGAGRELMPGVEPAGGGL
jgi:hypothetical protein